MVFMDLGLGMSVFIEINQFGMQRTGGLRFDFGIENCDMDMINVGEVINTKLYKYYIFHFSKELSMSGNNIGIIS